MEDLDHILLEQLHNARKSQKVIKTAKKLLPTDNLVLTGEELVEKRIKYLESMIQDKSLLRKKHKKKKSKDIDILAKNPVYDWYKSIFMATTFGYRIMSDSIKGYMSIFTRKTDKDG